MNENTKIYYSISEVCEITGLEPHVLRYWESEFSQLHPKKNRAGNRAYREKDILLVEHIKHLLYEEKFTIPGAKKRLADERTLSMDTELTTETDQENDETGDEPPFTIKMLKNELYEVLRLLHE